jgi:hypothetical protein
MLSEQLIMLHIAWLSWHYLLKRDHQWRDTVLDYIRHICFEQTLVE